MQDVYPLPRFCFYPGGAGVRITSAEELAALPPGWSSVPDGPFTEGVPGVPAPTVSRLEQVRALRAAGQTRRAIAVQLGLTAGQVSGLMKRVKESYAHDPRSDPHGSPHAGRPRQRRHRAQ